MEGGRSAEAFEVCWIARRQRPAYRRKRAARRGLNLLLWMLTCRSVSVTFRGRPSHGFSQYTNVEPYAMNRWGVCLGLFCFLSTVGTAQEQPTKFEVGPFFTYLRIPDSDPINAQNQAELGGRFSWNFARHFALDAELEASPFRTTNLRTSYQGGYLSQGFAGVKSGKRWNRFGIFGKFRAGFNSYSGAIIQASQNGSLILTFGRRTDPSFDIGGIFEFYVSRRVLLRYDLGDAIIHYNSSSVMGPGGQAIPVPSEVRNNFQFSTAVAFRF
jgi:hypothetical protein